MSRNLRPHKRARVCRDDGHDQHGEPLIVLRALQLRPSYRGGGALYAKAIQPALPDLLYEADMHGQTEALRAACASCEVPRDERAPEWSSAVVSVRLGLPSDSSDDAIERYDAVYGAGKAGKFEGAMQAIDLFAFDKDVVRRMPYSEDAARELVGTQKKLASRLRRLKDASLISAVAFVRPESSRALFAHRFGQSRLTVRFVRGASARLFMAMKNAASDGKWGTLEEPKCENWSHTHVLRVASLLFIFTRVFAKTPGYACESAHRLAANVISRVGWRRVMDAAGVPIDARM